MVRIAYPKEVMCALDRRILEGGELQRIADEFGVSLRMVCNHKKKLGLVNPSRSFSRDDEETVLRLWREGKTQFEIGSALGRTRGSIEAYLHRKGMKRHSWTDHKVLAANMMAEGDVALVGTPKGTLLTIQERISDIAEKHGVSRRTIRRAMLEIPAAQEERMAPRTSDVHELGFRASDYFEDLRQQHGEARIEALLSRLRAGEDPKEVTNELGLPLNLRILDRNFRWLEASAPKGTE